ncbi:hypothetical protein ACFPT3_01955 [Ectobacillus antri]|uniref:hypothetical protein n=2 Tax=Ectobacillus antri TaxID=2486280 RepID=UPI00360BA107
MDMLNEPYTEVMDGENLPFLVQLIIGSTDKGEKVSLSRLCSSPSQIHMCVYDVPELKPLRLQLFGSVAVTFLWNKIYEGKKERENRHILTKKQPIILLYEHGKTDYVYPWRCGIYHFEVIYNQNVYYGAFRICPKNFYDEQLTLIQNKVKSIMGSLIADRGYYKKTFSVFQDLEEHSQLKTIRWLSQRVAQITRMYKKIERDVGYKYILHQERCYRKPISATVRKNALYAAKGKDKYWNRRLIEAKQRTDLQYVKVQSVAFLGLLEELNEFLANNIQKLQVIEQSGKQEKHAVQNIVQNIEKNGSVTERDKQKYKNIQLLKETDLRKVSVKLQEYKVLYSLINRLMCDMRGRLHASFWNEIKISDAKPPMAPAYREFCHFMRKLWKTREEVYDEPIYLFVYKPTFLIYEYYVFFAVVTTLEDMGFIAMPSVSEQIKSYFYLDGLQDGTAVVTEKEDIRLRIVFNELIETHHLIALSKGSNFYNGEDTKKPDVRIDYFRKQNEVWMYQSSIIIEVKYSPMYNIFQPIGNTKATEQMYKYWSIKYVEQQDGRNVFHRRAIHEVICVYPGSQMHAKKIEAGCGIFLQFYPYIKKEVEHLMGQKELTRIITEWVQ